FPKNIDLVVEAPEDLPAVSGDPTQLYQVLMNLAVTARDAMPRGGVHRLAARAVAVAEDEIPVQAPAAAPGPYVELAVSDTGTGIPAEVLDRVFEPFFTTKDPGAGTGLGLSTALTIVQSHGGFFEVESSDVEGSVFRVLLPAVPAASEEAEAAEAKPEPERGEGQLVLVVDDEPTIRDVCCETLEAYGYRALTAADGAEAVALFARYNGEVAAVLTDLAMPIMDGPSAIRSIRRLNRFVPILAMSGLADRHGLDEVGEHGISAFLEKPFAAEELLGHLREALAIEPFN
ncbi:MAG TPA: response regulator, partial [Thermoanaerobaculia bacterium]|nr:response regulator [Thermoanaerobaculia bacterium]